MSREHARHGERRSACRSERRPTQRDARAPSRATFRRALRNGLVGGVVATVVMTVYRIPVFQALPPTAEFWAQYVGTDDADAYHLQGLLLHLAYGAGAGGVFGVLYAAAGRRLPFSREVGGVLAGVAYSVGLSVFGSRVVFDRVLDRDLDGDSALVFHLGHVVYGLTLGTWLSTRERVEDVYD